VLAPPVLRLVGVSHEYPSNPPVVALVDLTVDVPPGQITALVGPSGSGKSTALDALSLMRPPTRGGVEVAGQVVRPGSRQARRMRRRRMAVVRQAPRDNLFPYLTAADHVRLYARLRGGPVPDTPALLERVGLAEHTQARPNRLSGGEQQRLAVALALVGDPLAVLLDEPTSQLDEDAAASVIDAIGELTGSGAAVVVATHDPAVVAIADHGVELSRGEVVRTW
jgi:ABC-type lipoprotein export system ATPase subunit